MIGKELKKMRIITNRQYDLITEIIMEEKQKAEMLEAEKQDLQEEIDNMKIEIIELNARIHKLEHLIESMIRATKSIEMCYGIKNNSEELKFGD